MTNNDEVALSDTLPLFNCNPPSLSQRRSIRIGQKVENRCRRNIGQECLGLETVRNPRRYYSGQSPVPCVHCFEPRNLTGQPDHRLGSRFLNGFIPPEYALEFHGCGLVLLALLEQRLQFVHQSTGSFDNCVTAKSKIDGCLFNAISVLISIVVRFIDKV